MAIDTTWFPMTTGSSWTYRTDMPRNEFTVTVKGTDTTIRSIPYAVFSNSNGPSQYYCWIQSTVFQWGLDGIPIDIPILREDLTNGEWSDQLTVTGLWIIRQEWESEIIEMQRTISETDISAVLHLSRNVEWRDIGSGLVLNTETVHYYYAQGIGLIEVTSDSGYVAPYWLADFEINKE